MVIRVNKVITDKKTIGKVSVTSIGIEVLIALILYMIGGSIILPIITIIILHPVFIYITRQDPLLIDIYIGNFMNPKEMWF